MTSSTGVFFFLSNSGHYSTLVFSLIADDDDMTDLAEAIMEDCDGEVSEKFFPVKDAWYSTICLIRLPFK